MTICPICHLELTWDRDVAAGFCRYHTYQEPETWARTNRVMCDFFHRGVEPIRVELAGRDHEMWAVEDTYHWEAIPPSAIASSAVIAVIPGTVVTLTGRYPVGYWDP